MLLNLYIKNYALIEELHLEFDNSLNIFTGETGAGKSIIMECIGLLFGGRASSHVVRKGSDSCIITGEFDSSKLQSIKNYLKELSLNNGEDDIIIRREIDASSKSRAFINDKMVSISTLSNIRQYIVDIHGQHENQSLLQNLRQKNLLDSFGNTEKQLKKVSESFNLWQQFVSQKQALQISEQERQRLIELYSFQLNEIENAKLFSGEDEEIDRMLPQLKNAGRLRELSEESYQVLYGSEDSILDKLAKVGKQLEQINNLAGALSETEESFKSAYMHLQDISVDIKDFKDNLNADPEKLNDVMERQDLIHKLKKKYGSSVNDILLYKDKISKELEVLSISQDSKQSLDKKINDAEKVLLNLCEELSSLRKKAGNKFSKEVEQEFAELGMKKAHFNIAVEREQNPSNDGWDKIEFMFSANSGEDLQPLKNIASGGEMSRVMLALKTVLAKADNIPILIFDEIDAGIGGPAGQTVGKKLKALAKHHQIICITHLPQIAAFGYRHLFVEKGVKDGRTFTNVKVLNAKDRLEEIARMLSGEEITLSARKHASNLIESSEQF